jgi:predicted RNase H-like HicB family nuclease
MKSATEPKLLELSVSIIVKRDGDGFYAHCPALKGIHVDGKTEQEAVRRAVEAAKCYIDSMVRHNEPLPFGPDLMIEGGEVRHRPRVHVRHLGVQWHSLQACGVS